MTQLCVLGCDRHTVGESTPQTDLLVVYSARLAYNTPGFLQTMSPLAGRLRQLSGSMGSVAAPVVAAGIAQSGPGLRAAGYARRRYLGLLIRAAYVRAGDGDALVYTGVARKSTIAPDPADAQVSGHGPSFLVSCANSESTVPTRVISPISLFGTDSRLSRA